MHIYSPYKKFLPFAALAFAFLIASGASAPAKAQDGGDAGLPYITSFTIKADPALAAQVPEKYRKSGFIVVATNPNTPPTVFVGDDNRTLQGREIDIMTAIIHRLGLQPQWIGSGGFGNIVVGLASGRFDAALANLTVTQSRLKTVDFVSYYNSNRLGLIEAWTQSGNPPTPATNLLDLCGQTIGAGSGTTNVDALTEEAPACLAAGRKPVSVPLFPSRPAGVEAVVSGRLQGFFGPYDGLHATAELSHGRLYLAGVYTLPNQMVGIGLQKSSPLTPLVAEALDSLIKDGTYAAILHKWDISYGAIPEAKVNAAILADDSSNADVHPVPTAG